MLRETLLKHLPKGRVFEIMEIHRMIYRKCEELQFAFGDRAFIDPDMNSYVQCLIDQPCEGYEAIPHTCIPKRLTSSVQNSSLLKKVKTYLVPKIQRATDQLTINNLEYDLMHGFRDRRNGTLPVTLWTHVWNLLLLWVLSEVGGKRLQKEAEALERIAIMISKGHIAFDFKPNNDQI
ncbi:MAG: hypothetical protein AAB664_00345, partial [Patescibacteria group bacterium]